MNGLEQNIGYTNLEERKDPHVIQLLVIFL